MFSSSSPVFSASAPSMISSFTTGLNSALHSASTSSSSSFSAAPSSPPSPPSVVVGFVDANLLGSNPPDAAAPNPPVAPNPNPPKMDVVGFVCDSLIHSFSQSRFLPSPRLPRASVRVQDDVPLLPSFPPRRSSRRRRRRFVSSKGNRFDPSAAVEKRVPLHFFESFLVKSNRKKRNWCRTERHFVTS